MLKQRVLTALVLLLVLSAVLFAPVPWTFPAFMALLVAAATWEWARLSGINGAWSYLCAAVALLGCGVLWWALLSARLCFDVIHLFHLFLMVWSAVWLLGAIYLLRVGIASWGRIPTGLRMGAGFLTLWATWLAAVLLHTVSVAYLLSAMALVWVADSAAYFAGRAFGKRKLAVHVSPGKSWEGAIGGAIGVQLLAFFCALFFDSYSTFYSDIARARDFRSLAVMALIVVFLTVLSVLGDLVESLMKRGMGVKDSSRLLPGHGGVLDRVDALLPVLPAVATIAIWLNGK